MNSKSRIPSDAEFEAASRHMEAISQGMQQAERDAEEWLSSAWNIYRVYAIAENETSVRIYTFFERDEALQSFLNASEKDDYENFVSDTIANARSDLNRETVTHFEYDSSENIDNNFEGDYYRRMS